ncbi:uncharacterized protein RJT21DRAFT_18527 [Scheffersomyces amazonensis]|uniref:uncharacterized protein n=1 Tax=Scheffersomyces amazonensis TaxID=1078765 RepID=UPI00315CE76E
MAKLTEKLSGEAKDNIKILPRYEINCDMGEGYGPWKMGPDAEIMPYIDTANIACGGHAGDPKIMRETVRLAKKYNVRVGSHPGLPDKLGFGRRQWKLAPEDVYNEVVYQTGALKGFLEAEGLPLSYIKPHGELFFYIERDEEIMRAVLRAAKVFKVPVKAAKNKHYEEVAAEEGVEFIQEFYPDLSYSPEGNLVKIMAGPNATKTPELIQQTVLRAGLKDEVVDTEDVVLNLKFESSPFTVCLHSDMPNALDNVKFARIAIDEINKAKGYTLREAVSE